MDHYENGIFDINHNSNTLDALDNYLKEQNIDSKSKEKFVSDNTQHGVSGSAWGHFAYNKFAKELLNMVAVKYDLNKYDNKSNSDIKTIRIKLENEGILPYIQNDLIDINRYSRKKNQDGIDLYIKNSFNRYIDDYKRRYGKRKAYEEYVKKNFPEKIEYEDEKNKKCQVGK